MSKKKGETKKAVEEEVVNAVAHGYETHLAFIQHTTQTWEALAHAIDSIDILSGDEDLSPTAKDGKSDIAYALLTDIQLLKDLYESVAFAAVEEEEAPLK